MGPQPQLWRFYLAGMPGIASAASLALAAIQGFEYFGLIGVVLMGPSCGFQTALAGRLLGVPWMRLARPLLYACAFPIWGLLVSFCTLGLFAPIACSALWAAALDDRFGGLSWKPMLLLGTASNLIIVIMLGGFLLFNGGEASTGSVMIGSVLVWHLGYPLAMWALVGRRLSVMDSGLCPICGFSLEGLGRTQCPECGIRLNKLEGEPLEIDLRGYHEA